LEICDRIGVVIIDADLEIARRVSFDAAKQPIVLTEERTGLVRAANPAFLSLVGVSLDEVVGRSVVDLGLWIDEGHRNSFLSCLAIEGRLSCYPLVPAPRLQSILMYVSVDLVSIGDEFLHLMRFDIVCS
jgi:PAS domain-containing protein